MIVKDRDGRVVRSTNVQKQYPKDERQMIRHTMIDTHVCRTRIIRLRKYVIVDMPVSPRLVEGRGFARLCQDSRRLSKSGLASLDRTSPASTVCQLHVTIQARPNPKVGPADIMIC